jgi:hypothetical protein
MMRVCCYEFVSFVKLGWVGLSPERSFSPNCSTPVVLYADVLKQNGGWAFVLGQSLVHRRQKVEWIIVPHHDILIELYQFSIIMVAIEIGLQVLLR